jgi:cell division protease FtsH
MNKEFLKQISERREKLEYVKTELKKKFIGIDGVIDKIIDNIALWYLTPEIQFRPLIVSLWGITGVGKTDLVRTLVTLLGFNDKFVEIQMDMKNDYNRNIETYLENSAIETNEPAVLLLDEIQRYRTIDEMGSMLDVKHFNDLWMLLSDGKFKNNSERKRQIMEMLFEEMYWLDQRENAPDDETENDAPAGNSPAVGKTKKKDSKKLKYQTSFWTASRFKKMLNLSESAEDIMKMTLEQRMELMEESLNDGDINQGKSYEKLLIFISGNLDEAFKMADDVEDSESDADVMHELSKRINLIHIKNALARKFKPEQIARFGNNHIIYPCLDKKSYQTIIKMNCQEILDRVENEHGIQVKLSQDVYDVIYANGVFPAQGVRPAISTVFNLLGSNLPHFIYHALIAEEKQVQIQYEDKILYSQIGHQTVTKAVVLEIDDIRNAKTADEVMLVTVHEIGHALVYALLFNTPPKQININSAGLANGFVVNHAAIDNKTFLLDKLAIFLSGLVAEELVFGEEFKSSGAHMDIMFATDVAAKFVRAFGMDTNISFVVKKHAQTHYEGNYDVDKTNEVIENMLSEQKKRARDLINRNMFLYKELVRHAVQNKGMTIENFIKICDDNGLELEPKEINEKLIYSYDKKLNEFLNK